jgi:hypothetical protein
MSLCDRAGRRDGPTAVAEERTRLGKKAGLQKKEMERENRRKKEKRLDGERKERE